MTESLMDEEWEILTGFLPSDWRELARETGAIRRERGITDPELLLRLLLMHVATGLSLKQTVARAHAHGLAQISDVALLKRLRAAEAWLRELARRMYDAGPFAGRVASIPEGKRLRAVDATTVEEPGATGTDWRVHYSIALPEMACDFYEITDPKGAETYKRIPIAPGDVVLADRGYSHREGVAHVIDCGGDVIVRLNSATFPLLDGRGKPLSLLDRLRSLPTARPGDWPVKFKAGGKKYRGRLCAIRKSREAAEQAKRRLRREAAKKQRQLQPATLEAAEYIFVFTSLKRASVDVRAVLDLYRARWQIELCFKRMKSLLRLGCLPKRNDDSARAWMEGKLLVVMLIERLLREARFFSPWGYPIPASEPVARVPRSS